MLSPDYLASKWCRLEMETALNLNAKSELVVVPVICRQCEWQKTSFVSLVATPKDGKAIALWTHEDLAFFDIAQSTRRLIETRSSTHPKSSASIDEASQSDSISKYRARRDFSKVDRQKFLKASMEEFADFFKKSVQELDSIGHPFKAHFEQLEGDAFSILVENQDKEKAEAALTIRLSERGEQMTISYDFRENAGTHNEWFDVAAGPYDLFLRAGMQFREGGKAEYTVREAADVTWRSLLNRAHIEMA